MNYIDPVSYNELLNKFAKGTPKGILKENYIDLVPLNHLNEYMEEEEVENPGKYAGGPRSAFDKDGDGVPDGADKDPADGSKQEEGIHLDKVTGPTTTTVEGRYDFKALSPDEREQLKEYINSIKTIKAEVKKLMEKATIVEGGNTTDLVMTPEGPKMSDEEAEEMIKKHEDEKAQADAVAGSTH